MNRISKTAARAAPQAMPRPGFTVMELLIVMAIIALISSAILFAMFGALEEAKAARTRTQIAKLHEIISDRYDAFESRSLQFPAMASLSVLPDPREVARVRVLGLRDLMRMEMPDRITDVANGPEDLMMYYPNIYAATVVPVSVRLAQPSAQRNFQARASATWTVSHQGAECLYLIISSIREEGGDPIDYFTDSEIGDVDGDGMREILDAWGQPIGFLRWAPGYVSPMQVPNPDLNPDPFDPLKTDVRWRYNLPVRAGLNSGTYRLMPLIYSAGNDGEVEIVDQGSAFFYRQTPLMAGIPNNPPWPFALTPPAPQRVYPNDPYYLDSGTGYLIGEEIDLNGDGIPGYADNITNHLIEVK